MINTMATLRTHLAAQSALTDLTGSRIWAALTFPPKDYTPSTGAALVFNGRGGLGLDYSGQLLRESVQFKCYAANELAALTLYGTLVDVLHDSDGDGMRRASLEIPGQVLREPDPVGWPFVLTFFEVLYDSQLGG